MCDNSIKCTLKFRVLSLYVSFNLGVIGSATALWYSKFTIIYICLLMWRRQVSWQEQTQTTLSRTY